MPMFLTSIGFSVLWIGIFEGIAEATAGFSKGYFGKMSDSMGRRVPFIRLGYFLSSIAKPAMAFFANPVWVLFVRTTDRLGKGIRTSARDAMLSSESTSENKGKVFGFHRTADTIGAAIGPVIALVFLYFYPKQYSLLFFLAFIPAIAGVFFTFIIKDKPEEKKEKAKLPGLLSFLGYWKIATAQYRRLVSGLLVFAVVNSSDVFLLLIAKHRGLSDELVIGAYIFYNLVYALFSTPLGYLGDKIGLKNSFVIGLIFFTLTYAGVGFAETPVQFFGLFFLYGIYAAGTEGISKAWLSNIAKKEETATAIGFFNSFQSVATLIASVMAGILWNAINPVAPFILASLVAIVVAVFLKLFVKNEKPLLS
jgi:MFS family permease